MISRLAFELHQEMWRKWPLTLKVGIQCQQSFPLSSVLSYGNILTSVSSLSEIISCLKTPLKWKLLHFESLDQWSKVRIPAYLCVRL